MPSIELTKSDTAYILVNGPSIDRFKDYIHLCKNDNVYWCSINRFHAIEDKILSLIDSKFDILYCGSWSRYREFISTVGNFQGIFITNSNSFIGSRIFYDKLMISDWGFGYNSLVALILTLSIKKIKKIYIFGADGHGKADNMYYAQDTIKEEDFKQREFTINRDTEVMNRSFWRLYEDMFMQPIEIINVNNGSSITCFEQIDYDEFIDRKNNGL